MENDVFNEFEERVYLDPTQSRNEQLSFIDTLRETQANNTAQINADTYALGSQLPSNLGGLRGAEDTFVARYQTPQINQTVANLRLAAQQSALNTALSNLQNAYKKRYNDAMFNYQKRAATAATTPKTTTDGDTSQGEVITDTITETTISPDTLLPDGTPNSVVSGPAGTTAVNPDGNYTEYTNADGARVREYNDGHIEVFRDGQWVREGETNAPFITENSFGKLPGFITNIIGAGRVF